MEERAELGVKLPELAANSAEGDACGAGATAGMSKLRSAGLMGDSVEIASICGGASETGWGGGGKVFVA
ncbi:hypothetical protein H6F88_11005 [Oculatella sp. FACHB-28]|nr:hypothetical protein [Oculatella sp. FACHB-28]